MMRLQPRMVSASGFSHMRVEAQVEQLGGGVVVRAGVGRAVGRFEAVDLAHHPLGVAEDARPFAEQLVGLVGQILGVLRVQVAHRDQVEVHVRGVRQLRQARQMAPPHSATADNCQPNRILHALRSVDRLCQRQPQMSYRTLMASKVRFGIVGTGGIANTHAAGLAALADDAELVACCDVRPNRAADFAERWGVQHHYDSARAHARRGPDRRHLRVARRIRSTPSR